MKQTAVEWLVREFNLESYKATVALLKEMEKKQIIDAYEKGRNSGQDYVNSEQYFTETFKINKNEQ